MGPVEGEMTIRWLKEEDVDAISEIYSLITKKAVNDDFKRQVREKAVKNEHVAPFVADIDGKIVGFMITYIVTLGFGAEKSGYIATMGIHPRYMGQRVGAGMADEVFKFYKSQGISRVYASIRWDSTDILSFFKTIGFERSNFINLKKDVDSLIETD